MLIGAHVSPAGGLPRAIERGTERSCSAIQIFNQSPRMWRAREYAEDDVLAFREAMAASPIRAVLIHAVYLLNCASDDAEMRSKSLASLVHSLRAGDRIGAHGVILHPGSAKAGDVTSAIARCGETPSEAAPASCQRPRFRACRACWRHPESSARGPAARKSSSPSACTSGAWPHASGRRAPQPLAAEAPAAAAAAVEAPAVEALAMEA